MAFFFSDRIDYFIKVVLLRYLPFLPIGIFSFVFLYFGTTGEFPGITNYQGYIAAVLITLVSQIVITRNNRWLDKSLNWKKAMGWRFVLGFLINLLSVLGIAIVLSLLYLALLDLFQEPIGSYFEIYRNELIKMIILIATVILLYSVSYFAFYSIKSYSKGELALIEQKRNQLELQLEVLKSQLSPHYLFNSLNTISSLIYKDTQLAEDFIRGLAQSYRYILTTNDKISVSLHEELEFVKSYHYLLKVRFENNITLDINLSAEAMQSEIPPLTLQMLVENAVKHNKISGDSPLSINISSNEKEILVSNTKTGDNADVQSHHIGIENIKRRYSYLTERAVKVIDSEQFKVQLPVVSHS